MTARAAGVLFATPDKQILFLRRAGGGDFSGHWALPGGGIEDGESEEEAAVRECREEIGFCPDGKREVLTRRVKDDVDFTTYLQRVDTPFDGVILNEEHDGYAWASSAPEPAHPGVAVSVARLTMDELGVARAMSEGELVSPQRYDNMTMFAVRVTGTGMAYRKALNEYVWRSADVYLNPEFLARCNGLPLVWEHPGKAMLDSQEFAERIIGTVFLPYIKGDEVWAIVKVYDDEAAKQMAAGQLSTSPAVVFRDPEVNDKRELEDGAVLLEEGKPSLLDHLAVCSQGVWDKAGPPAGVLNETIQPEPRADSMTDDEKKADADAGQKLDKLLTHLDSISSRLDAMEMADKARRDAEEKDKAERDDAARKDRARIDAEEHDKWQREDAAACAKDDADEDEAKSKYEKEGATKEDAAARARKDRKDAMETRRKDAEAEKAGKEEKEVEEAKKDSTFVALRAENEALAKRLAALEADRNPPADEEEKFSAAQARADATYMNFGLRAPRRMSGETPFAYEVRLLKGVQKHSKRWSGLDLHQQRPEALPQISQQIYADADIAARSPDDLAAGALREIVKTDVTGRRISTFVGSGSFIDDFKRPSRRVVNINTRTGV